MNTPHLPAEVLYFLASFGSCLLALVGAGYLARPRRPLPATPLPLTGDEDELLKTYLDHHALC